MIKEYFANYLLHTSDLIFDLGEGEISVHRLATEPWRVTLVDTGADTRTGGRLKRAIAYAEGETFCMTYGDGLSDVDRCVVNGDIAAIFEHRPLTRGVVSSRVFDETAALLRRTRASGLLRQAGLVPCEHRYFAFLPCGGNTTASIETALRRVPLGAQCYVSGTRG